MKGPPTKLEIAGWLRERLSDGAWHPMSTIWEAAAAQGFTRRATYAALNMVCEKRPMGKNVWGCRLMKGTES